MSPRTDSYLSMCLEQASKSPLHYRHGCIIVRGGKIIGQGYNHYRPGFNGGALKTGRLATSSPANGIAMTELKQRKKLKTKPDPKPKATGTFIPFEEAAMGGGGHLANTPLSMHSEMMAIHCALSLSGTLASQGSARSARWLEKPCFKLPSRDKRQLRLRGLKAYVKAVCAESEQQQQQAGVRPGRATGGKAGERGGKVYVQGSCFETSASQCGEEGEGGGQQQRGQRGQGRLGGEQWQEIPGSESVCVSSRGSVSRPPSPSRTGRTATTCT